MFLKKIKKDNRGIDISLVGTSYTFVLILVICAVFDLMIINYCKIAVMTGAKECALYSLAKNFKWEWMMYDQHMDNFNRSDAELIQQTFVQVFDGYAGRTSAFANGCSIVKQDGINGSGVNVLHERGKNSIILTVPKIVIYPKKILGKIDLPDGRKGINRSDRLTLIGQKLSSSKGSGTNITNKQVSAVAVEGNQILTGVSCKIEFFEQLD